MLDVLQAGAVALAQDQPVRADLDAVLADLQVAAEQDRHARDMQDVALVGRRLPMRQVQPGQVQQRRPRGQVSGPLGVDGDQRQCAEAGRSEEHTSELQSLMRISYAVFCLKKNTTHRKPKTNSLSTQKHHNMN